MSPGRRHPLSRREDEDLAAALAASSRETTSLSADKDDALAPTASLAALPKFGSIHGTLGSTIPQPHDLQHPTQPVARSSSDERLAIASSSASFAPHTTAAGQTARVLVADTPIASATGRTSASDPIVTASTSTDSSLSAAARRATMATEGISSFSSEGKLGGRNSLTVPGVALNPLGIFGKLPPLPGGGQEDEVVGDSDGEGGGERPPLSHTLEEGSLRRPRRVGLSATLRPKSPPSSALRQGRRTIRQSPLFVLRHRDRLFFFYTHDKRRRPSAPVDHLDRPDNLDVNWPFRAEDRLARGRFAAAQSPQHLLCRNPGARQHQEQHRRGEGKEARGPAGSTGRNC